MAKQTSRPAPTARLVVSDAQSPQVSLKPGMCFEVTKISVVNEKLKAGKVGARLCGGTSTCLALIDLDIHSNFP